MHCEIRTIPAEKLFDVSDTTFPGEATSVTPTDWDNLTIALYRALHDGQSPESIWDKIHASFAESLDHDTTKAPQILMPYVTDLFLNIHNAMAQEGRHLFREDLKKLHPQSGVNKYLSTSGVSMGDRVRQLVHLPT